MLGIYLKDTAEIAAGRKTMIPCPVLRDNLPGQHLLIVKGDEGAAAVGLIKVGQAQQVSVKEFDTFHTEHQISQQDRMRWWADAEPLYLYPVESVGLFDHPLDCDLKPGTKMFLDVPYTPTLYRAYWSGGVCLCEANDGS